MKHFFTADEHYEHKNIIKYCDRPFHNKKEMRETLISNHNEVVSFSDIVYHIGDFTYLPTQETLKLIDRLNGKHVFIRGSHDYWMGKRDYPMRVETKINKQQIVMDHYPMSSWRWSYHGSWQLHGHWHFSGNVRKNRINICVDNTDFYPLEFDQIQEMIKNQKFKVDEQTEWDEVGRK